MNRSEWLILLASAVCLAPGAAGEPAYLQLTRAGAGVIEVRRPGAKKPILVQNAPSGMRPYIHPLIAPDGNGEITEFRPSHHKHQTGIFFGFAEVNGRSFFHNTDASFFRARGLKIARQNGRKVSWTVVTDWLGENGQPLLTETQQWTMEDHGAHYVLDLDWSGRAAVDVTVGKYDYGGLFIRMPWRKGIDGAAVNSEGLSGKEAEGQRARWVDVGMAIEGRQDWAHIALLDHRDNPDYPVPWRVDGNLGIVPSRSRLGDWKIAKGAVSRARYRLLVYTGALQRELIEKNWNSF